MNETVIQLRNGSTHDWLLFDPILARGEVGVENDKKYMKVGDGSVNWKRLNVFPPTPDFHPFITL